MTVWQIPHSDDLADGCGQFRTVCGRSVGVCGHLAKGLKGRGMSHANFSLGPGLHEGRPGIQVPGLGGQGTAARSLHHGNQVPSHKLRARVQEVVPGAQDQEGNFMRARSLVDLFGSLAPKSVLE